MAFTNVRGGNSQAIDMYNAYLRAAGDQVRMLSSVLPAVDLNRVLTTPRYWMLHSIDPAGKASTLASLMSLELDEKIRLLEEAADSLKRDSSTFGQADLIVVPDTNVLLHHDQSVASVPWASLAPTDSRHIVVAVPILVVDELDRAKRRGDRTENGLETVRTRARRTIATLEGWFADGRSYTLPDSTPVIEFVLVLDDPMRPRLADADYEIIDNAHTIADVAGRRVVIASGDAGMRLRARAAGVEAMELPPADSVTPK